MAERTDPALSGLSAEAMDEAEKAEKAGAAGPEDGEAGRAGRTEAGESGEGAESGEKEGGIAAPEEVLRVITRIMRGQGDTAEEQVPVSERRRAAELLARRYGLLEDPEAERTEARRRAARAIEDAVARMRAEWAREEERRGGGPSASTGTF